MIVLSAHQIENDRDALTVAAIVTTILSPALYYGVENRYRGKKGMTTASHGLLFSLAMFLW